MRALALVLTLFLVDQGTKIWAAATLPGRAPSPLLPGLFDLLSVENPGMAWGLLSNATLPLAVLRVSVGLALLALVFRGMAGWPRQLSLSLIAAGALGNALDGFRLGFVVDLLSSPALSKVTRLLGAGDFPVFNLADVWVVLGTLLLSGTEFRKRPHPTTSPSA